MDELSPILKELTQYPIAFLGGLASGLFRLNLNEDPVKGWLEQRTGQPLDDSSLNDSGSNNGNGSGPQSISIE